MTMITIRDICTGPVYRWKQEGVPPLEIRARIMKIAQENGFARCEVSGTDEDFDLVFDRGGVIRFSEGKWEWKPKQG